VNSIRWGRMDERAEQTRSLEPGPKRPQGGGGKTEVTGQPERLKQNNWSKVEKPERQLSHVWRQNGEKRWRDKQ